MLRLPRATDRRRASPLAALGLAVLAACGGSTPVVAAAAAGRLGAASASTSPTAASSGTATGRTIAVTVTGKQVTPAPATVDLAVGETLTLTVTSDHDDQLHAHGFEIETGRQGRRADHGGRSRAPSRASTRSRCTTPS